MHIATCKHTTNKWIYIYCTYILISNVFISSINTIMIIVNHEP